LISGSYHELDKASTNQLNPELLYVGQYLLKPLNAKLNPICHLLALLGAHPIFHISGLRVNGVNARPAVSRCEPNVNLYLRQHHQETA
jgi:hypothetical protein